MSPFLFISRSETLLTGNLRSYIFSIIVSVLINLGKHMSREIFFRVFLVFNAAFNYISAISWQSVLLVEVTEVSGENHRPANTFRLS